MKIFKINAVPYGSTAKIMLGIARVAQQRGIQTLLGCGYSYHPILELKGKYTRINGKIDKALHMLYTRVTGLHGVYSKLVTWKLLKTLKKFKPDIIHLHNLHGWYINLPMLFNYIKKNNIRTIWTLHDCWSFTGHCPHFDMIGCEKWKTGCYECPQYREYPQSWVDNSKKMYKRKKQWFTGVHDMTLITPSRWLADLTKQSFLKDYPVQVINNGIDLNAFKPAESDFRQKYNCVDKFVLLGVAFGWGKRKGLDVFIELAKRLDDKYQIVLVGTDENTDKVLPKNIISIHRTQNQKELAEIYTVADLFVNPTREENFPTVNIEALACGIPIVTFKTGGSPEILDKSCGVVVEKDNTDELEKQIRYIYEHKPFAKEDCLQRAREFDMNTKFEEYVKLYNKNDKQ